ncbi:hypothetical protein [Halovivax asiaticus]|uniref:hypothetical protein n=1 Tax=Halovivax asiaticus TaxID=332953 RepID=UPI000677F605|nr:hypothetical protein [Halovivax asiaticus]
MATFETYTWNRVQSRPELDSDQQSHLNKRVSLVVSAIEKSLEARDDAAQRTERTGSERFVEPADSDALTIDEGPPEYNEGSLDPKSWVGELTPAVEILPRDYRNNGQKLSKDQYLQIANEVQDWAEIIGPSTISAALPLNPDVLLDRYAQIAPISNALIEQTEALLAQRPPVEVERIERHGPEPRGRIKPNQTMRKAAQRSGEVVSTEVNFTPDTLQNRLLVRFHAELAGKMVQLSEAYPQYGEMFESQLSYHQHLLEQRIFNKLRDVALETDFADAAVLSQLRDQADQAFQVIVDLWEAYLQNANLELALANNFTSALKPLSNTYELWCLRLLLEVLSDLTGQQPSQRLQGTYDFPGDITLHYNQSGDRPRGSKDQSGLVSQYFRTELNLGRGSGFPDFAITQDGDGLWVADAKFKHQKKLDDHRQVLAYAVDLLRPSKDATAALLYGSTEVDETEGEVREYTFIRRSIHPDAHLDPQTALSKQLKSTLSL